MITERLEITPMAFAESMYLLQGKPMRFGPGRSYLKAIHNAEIDEMLLMTGRQVEKSTTESVKIANNILNRPFSSSLYVAPLNEQVKTFSRSRLDKLFRYSQGDIIRKRYMSRDLVNQVFHKEFSNGAEVYLRNCYEEADNIRGLSIDDVFIDEIQDILVDALPVIFETQTRSKKKHRVFTGTPKTFSNTIQQQWEKSSQADWVIRCPACRKHQILGIESVTPSGFVCRNPRCRKPLHDMVRAFGRWEHRNPERKLKGFRITQMMVPDISPADIFEKIEGYPILRLKNEVLGESYENADKPFTQMVLNELTDWDTPMIHAVFNTKYANTSTFMGVDWGEGEKSGQAGTGYTVVTICAYDEDEKFRVLFTKRFERGDELDPDYQQKMILKYAENFRCKMVIADYGAGEKENKRLQKVLKGRFAQCQYVGEQKKPINYDKAKFKYLIPRSEWMTDFIEYANDGNLRFFGKEDDGAIKYIHDNFKAIYSEYRKSRNGMAERLFYGHDASQPDDAFHSTFYSWFGSLIYKGGTITPQGSRRGSPFKSVRAS